MSRLLTTTLLLMLLALFSSGYYAYSLFLESALLKGAQKSLQGRYTRTQQALKKSQQELEKSRRELKQTRKALHQNQQKLARIERKRPRGVRKLADKASRIPLVGTIATVGLIAADAVEAATACYQEQAHCIEEIESLYQEGRGYLLGEEPPQGSPSPDTVTVPE
jgi:Tfp pilus assembly protein PilN